MQHGGQVSGGAPGCEGAVSVLGPLSSGLHSLLAASHWPPVEAVPLQNLTSFSLLLEGSPDSGPWPDLGDGGGVPVCLGPRRRSPPPASVSTPGHGCTFSRSCSAENSPHRQSPPPVWLLDTVLCGPHSRTRHFLRTSVSHCAYAVGSWRWGRCF